MPQRQLSRYVYTLQLLWSRFECAVRMKSAQVDRENTNRWPRPAPLVRTPQIAAFPSCAAHGHGPVTWYVYTQVCAMLRASFTALEGRASEDEKVPYTFKGARALCLPCTAYIQTLFSFQTRPSWSSSEARASTARDGRMGPAQRSKRFANRQYKP